MQLAAVATICILLLAGCSSQTGSDSHEDEIPGNSPGSNETEPPGDLPPPPDVLENEPRVQQLFFDYATRSYGNELVRYAVVARDNVTVDVSFAMGLYPNGFDPGCAAFSMQQPPQDNRSALGTYLVAWETDADVYFDARSGGDTVTLVPDQFDGERPAGVLMTWSYNDTFTLPAGTYMLLEVGGSGPHLFEPAASGQAPYGNVSLQVAGDAAVVPLPQAPLRCGVGARESNNGTGASTYLLDIEHGGAIASTTTNASTTIISEPSALHGSLRLDFLGDQEEVLAGAARSAQRGGDMSLMFEEWVGIKQPGWLFADTYWPILD